jgi:hypothetical protein
VTASGSSLPEVQALLAILSVCGRALEPGWPGHDPVREFWVRQPEFRAMAILTTPATAVLLAARVG